MVTPEREEAAGVDESVGTLLRAWRQERGLSLNALARQARLGNATLSRWEAGARQPSITELEAALAALQATPTQREAALARICAPRAVQALRQAAGDDGPPIAGDLLRAMRLRRGRTLEETARAVGVAHVTLRRWERGESRPSSEHLHTLCYTLNAHPTEAAALTLGSGPWLMPERTAGAELGSVAKQAERLRLLSQRLEPLAYQQRGCVEADGLRDLGFLALEAALWPLAHRGSTTTIAFNARHQLAHAYARHAEYLADHARWSEAAQSAQQSLKAVKPLFREPGARRRLQFTAWPVAALVTARAAVRQGGSSSPVRQRAAAGRGAQTLLRWLEQKPGRPAYHAWMLTEIADYFVQYGDVERALATARTACRLVEDSPQVLPEELALRRRDYARLLTQAGRAQEALALLQSASGVRGDPIHHVSEDLLWAEALWAAGDTAGAQQRLSTARPLITGSHLGSLRARADALAAKL